jgi:hypothetical protein
MSEIEEIHVIQKDNNNNNNSIKKRKLGRPKKSIWEHFIEINDLNSNKKDNHPGAKCIYCKQQWTRGKSSDMIAHIALSCSKPPPPDVRAKFQSILQNKYVSDDDNGDDDDKNFQCKKGQPKITDKFEKSKVTDEKQRRCIHALTKFFVCCGVPFWIVENPFFIHFIKSLCPGFQLPKRTTLSTTLVNMECSHVISNINNSLNNQINLTLGNMTNAIVHFF